jgi:hypothetical protein
MKAAKTSKEIDKSQDRASSRKQDVTLTMSGTYGLAPVVELFIALGGILAGPPKSFKKSSPAIECS